MSKKYTLIIATVLSIAVLALAACAPSYSPGAAPAAAPTSAQAAAPTSAPAATTVPTTAPTTAPAPTSAPAAAPTKAPAAATAAPAGPTVGVQVAQNAALGKFLADQDGRTLYVFLKDTKNVSNCNGSCPTTWPPLTTQGKPTAQNGVNAALLGTFQRQDGSTQVTYNGQPLYHYGGDKAMGDTKGQAIGGFWFVVGPDGNPVKSTSSSAPAPAPVAQPTSPYHY